MRILLGGIYRRDGRRSFDSRDIGVGDGIEGSGRLGVHGSHRSK